MRANVVGYLEESARRTPDACAVEDDAEALTYAQLLDRSRRAGSYLARAGVARQGVIIAMEKSAQMLSVMMGTLYAGAFYVPVDPHMPHTRLRQIIQRVGATLVVAESEEVANALADDDAVRVVQPSQLVSCSIDEDALAVAERNSLETDPAYVLFTSGSTGEPKGVTITHRAIQTFIQSFTSTFGFTASDRFGNQAPFDFDVSTKDIYGALSIGATLVIIPRQLFMQPVALVEYLAQHKVTILTWAVAALGIVSAYHALEGAHLDTVRMVLFSGEVMPHKHLVDWRTHMPQATFVNLYGPTEITCNCLYHVLDPNRSYDEGIPLGTEFDHCNVYLVSDDGTQVQEPGEKGEIVVSGPSLSLGYLGMPQQTAAAFCQNPLNHTFPERVYKSGDLGMLSEQGELFFAGRKDNQIKFQGHRIELEEIDVAFERLQGVDRCRCVFDERTMRLRAFYEGTASKQDLLDLSKQELPSHMRPSSIEKIESMPLNKHGKVDRGALLQAWKQARRARRAGGAQ